MAILALKPDIIRKSAFEVLSKHPQGLRQAVLIGLVRNQLDATDDTKQQRMLFTNSIRIMPQKYPQYVKRQQLHTHMIRLVPTPRLLDEFSWIPKPAAPKFDPASLLANISRALRSWRSPQDLLELRKMLEVSDYQLRSLTLLQVAHFESLKNSIDTLLNSPLNIQKIGG